MIRAALSLSVSTKQANSACVPAPRLSELLADGAGNHVNTTARPNGSINRAGLLGLACAAESLAAVTRASSSA
jgi:hypothetical protein